MKPEPRPDWQAIEAAALEAALAARRHIRACRSCSGSADLCDVGRELLAAADGGIKALGDRMVGRARAARALQG